MKEHNISAIPIRVIKHLYDRITNVVLFNGSIEDWFRTTGGVKQGCLLSHFLFNIFLERIIDHEDHEGTVGIGGRTIHQSPLC